MHKRWLLLALAALLLVFPAKASAEEAGEQDNQNTEQILQEGTGK